MGDSYILLDNQFQPAQKPIFRAADLSAVCITETIRVVQSQIPFWSGHLQVINQKFSLLGQCLPAILNDDGALLRRQIDRFLVKNKWFKSSVLKIHFFRAGSSFTYFLEGSPLPASHFEWNEQGLAIDLFPKLCKPECGQSALMPGSRWLWDVVLAAAREEGIDDWILLNEKGFLAEAVSQNIYLVFDNRIITPSVKSGAFANLSQSAIQQACAHLGVPLVAETEIAKEALLGANEVFLAGAVWGIQWVKAFQDKRYYNKITRKLNEIFNQILIH